MRRSGISAIGSTARRPLTNSSQHRQIGQVGPGAANANQELLDAAYREGQLDLPSLVLLRNQLFDAEVGYWEAWLARRHSFNRLAAVGGDPEADLEAL